MKIPPPAPMKPTLWLPLLRLGRSVVLWSFVSLLLLSTQGAAPPVVTSLGACQQLLHPPGQLAVNAAGRLYITEPQSGKVVVVDSSGQVLTVKENLGVPLGIAVDDQDRIYLGDEASRSVSVFDKDWKRLYQLGQGEGEFTRPNSIALLPAAGGVWVYVSDSPAHEVKVYQGTGLVRRFGSRGMGSGELDYPAGLAASEAGEIFVSDLNNDRIAVFDREGNYRRTFPLRLPGFSGRSGRVHALAWDGQGLLYAADTFQGFVKVFDPQGTFLTTIGSYGTGAGQLRSPIGLAIDQQNRLFVASANNGRVEVFGLEPLTAPVILSSPANQVVGEGAEVSFSVSAQGGGLSYRWLFNGTDLNASNNATMVLPKARLANGGNYQVIVTNLLGSTTSSVARLTVMLPQLSLRKNAVGDLVLSWDNSFTNTMGMGYVLESAESLAGPWWPVISPNGTIIPKAVLETTPMQFLRLRDDAH